MCSSTLKQHGMKLSGNFPPSSIGEELGILGYKYTNVVGAVATPKGAYYEMGVNIAFIDTIPHMIHYALW